MSRRRPWLAAAALGVGALIHALCAPSLEAKVLRLEITERRALPTLPTELGAERVPPYEKLAGSVVFGVDPENPRNLALNDLMLAPRNAEGLVEASANFMVLRPLRPEDDRGLAFLEVSNRGGKASLRYFQNASTASRDPETASDLGDGLLMRQGLTLMWVGWQLDVPLGPGVLALDAPVVSDRGRPVFGRARSDWVVDTAVNELELGHRNHRAYPPAVELEGHELTARSGREGARSIVPASQWRFVELDIDARTASGGEPGDPVWAIRKDGGFEAGKIYELVYLSGRPKLVGMGLVAVRDFLSFAKYDPTSPFRVRQGIGFGVSQTGRFLRTFLYQGFNADEAGRRVFDGLLIHTAGAGRGSFNHRFAQPSRDAHRYSAFFYPTDLFPFSAGDETDPLTGDTDGLLRVYQNEPELVPKIFFTNTGYEYWGRAAALIHTSPDGERDLPEQPQERIYHLASAQHFVDAWPIPESSRIEGSPAYRGDPVDLLVPLRALLIRLVEWVANDREPPPSSYPKLADGTLAPIVDYRLPILKGVGIPSYPHVAYRADYGPNWSIGIVDHQPPRLGPAFPALVPTVDEVGNERGGLRPVEVAVPVATFLPWSLRNGLANSRELTDFRGQTIPLAEQPKPPSFEARSPGDRDPRPSLQELYPGGIEQYRRAVEAEIDRQVAAGVLLEEDRRRVINRTRELWTWAISR